MLATDDETDWVNLRAPRNLGVDSKNLGPTISYLNSIRRRVLAGESIVVDLRRCESISSAACLLLCAEIEFCRGIEGGGLVNGLDPEEEAPRRAIFDLGFHKYLAHSGRQLEECGPSSLIIHSGTDVTDSTAFELAQIADLAKGRLPDALVEVVLGCLQEAMINIQDHAYTQGSSYGGAFGRWWFAGALLDDGLIFLAYDRGDGVVKKSLETMISAIVEYWRNRGIEPDLTCPATVLEAALNARREGIDLGGRGRGFPFMINMIERGDARGRLYVVSGAAAARFTRLGQAAAALEVETLKSSLSGTLFAWQVCKARRPKQ